MSDPLLPYYNRELSALRRLAAGFAEAHPKIAGRLRLSPDAVDDPHVERLLEGVAFLGARVQQRLDDELPELTDALLGVLYPHYLAPFPSCAMMQFDCPPDRDGPAHLPAGLSLDAEPVRGERCRFRTAWPQTLWPIEIESVQLTGLPLASVPPNPRAAGAVAVLRIGLRCLAPGATFSALGLDRLRCFIRGPQSVSLPLLELLQAHTLSVAYADGTADGAPAILPASAVAPVGFAPEEAILPWPARSFSGFRLLSEYFAFPEKFLFVDFTGIERKTLLQAGTRLTIFVYLDRQQPELERLVGAETLALGCVPVVNLFQQHCEPIALSHTAIEYRVVPDARRQAALEVWQIETVQETKPDGQARVWQPFYRLSRTEDEAASFQALRRHSALGGSETFLAPYDARFDPDEPADSILSVDALCFNRDLPAELPFGQGHPAFTLTEGHAAVARLRCLTAPTPTLRPPLRDGRFWRLISHLSLSHLSMTGGAAGAEALREVLRLYDLHDTPETRAAIDGLVAVTAQPGVARVPGGRAGSFCRGLDVTLEFDARPWQASGLFLLASVLDRFLALHATVNSFVRTRAVLRGRTGAAAIWPPRAGTRALL
ncbi:MAG: type VI secretion system baseplate subunit TssF [Proteobacteria bacterium]|nr:type VI secretion system baseplate subunit TssF [Pseudomonadota bacterium]